MNKKFFKKKLIIGTANFTQKYGTNNKKIRLDETKKILDLAKKNQINSLDTAESYLSNHQLFKDSKYKFKLISKINPDDHWTSYDYCKKKLLSQIKKLNNSIEILLFHDVNILYKKKGEDIFNNIKLLKKRGFFKKIGISIYDPSCLNYLISRYDIEVVQCPFNILDKRIVTSGWLSRLQKKDIEVHARSVFLQGILVNEEIYKIQYFNKWKKFFFEWFQNLRRKKISPIDYCLSDISSYNFDRIIIGINNSNNLIDIINFKLIEKKKRMLKFKINDLSLIDPRNWRVKKI